MRETRDEPTQLWECDRCDGCGWYEGGKTLATTCEDCGGTGVVERHRCRCGHLREKHTRQTHDGFCNVLYCECMAFRPETETPGDPDA